MSREIETDALLLRGVDYGESDRVCTLLTREAGKLAVFARGARGSKKRFRGGLGAFVELRVVVRARGADSMPSLAESEATASHTAIGSDLVKMAAGTHALELVDLALHDAQGAELFETVLRFVRWLSAETRGAVHVDAGLHRLQLLLLSDHGALPDLATCARTGVALADAVWLPDVGLVSAESRHLGEAGAELDGGTLAYLRAVGAGHFPTVVGERTREQVRRALLHVWRHLIGREPRSWGFYDATVR